MDILLGIRFSMMLGIDGSAGSDIFSGEMCPSPFAFVG